MMMLLVGCGGDLLQEVTTVLDWHDARWQRRTIFL